MIFRDQLQLFVAKMADCHPTGKERVCNLQFYFNNDNVNHISVETFKNLKKGYLEIVLPVVCVSVGKSLL